MHGCGDGGEGGGAAKGGCRGKPDADLQSQVAVLELLVAHCRDQLAYLDPDFNFVFVNRAYAEACRKPVEELLGRNHFELFPHAENQAIFERVRDTGRPAVLREKPFVLPDLPERVVTYWDWTLTPEKGLAGRVTGLVFSLRDVTDKVRARREIEASELEVRAFFENASVGAAQLRGDGTYQRVNDRYCEITGYSREELLAGMKPGQLTHPDDQARDQEFLTGVMQGRLGPSEIEKRIIRKDGRVAWMQVTSNAVRDAEGRVVRGGALVQDITERKQAEERLRASQERLAMAVEASGLGLWDWDLVADRVHLSAEFQRLTGFKQGTVESGGDFLCGIAHPSDATALHEAMTKHLQGELPRWVAQCRLRNAAGDYLWVHAVGQVTARDNQGTPLRVSGVVIDLTERKQLEEELRERQALLLEAGRLVHLGHWDRDLRTGQAYWSDEIFRILGLAPGTTPPSQPAFLEMVVPEDRQRMAELLRSTGIDGITRRTEYRVVNSQGQVRTLHGTVELLRDSEGSPARLLGTVQDITERKAAELERERLVEDLRDSDRRKNEFLAMLSHELRNPLAPIKNSLFILDRASPDSDQARRALMVLNRQVNQLSRLVDDLLDLTRISSNKVVLKRQRVELNELVRRTLEDHRSLFENNGIDLELAPAPRPVFVNADSNRLAQVVGNLLHNGSKFTPRGGRATVSVAADDAVGKARILVADSGVGMTAEMLGRLFRPFMQADNALDRNKGGLGLGLALVKGLVELHGGEVGAHSAGLGEGSQLVVALPLDVRPGESTEFPRGGARGSRRRVLIIEDNADAADTLRQVLELSQHEVAVAHDGPDGLARARELLPEIVLCDLGLPAMDGYGVARAFRADEKLKSAYLVALSGYALPQDVERSREAGFDLHLAKPPSIEQLEGVLASVPVHPEG